MSDRSDWVPIAAGVAVGAGLLVVLYKMFFSGGGSYSKTVNQNIGAPKYCCTCRKAGIALADKCFRFDNPYFLWHLSAEELERRRKAPPIPSSSASSAGKAWLPVLGGATLLAIIALLFKSWDKVKSLVWRTDNTCGPIIKKRKREPEEIKLCICKD